MNNWEQLGPRAQKEKMAGYAPEELTISIISNSYVLNFKIFQ